MKRLWPRSLRGQMILLVLLGLLGAQAISYVIYRTQQQSALLSLRYEYVLNRIAAVERLLNATPSDLHREIVRTASTPPLRFKLSTEPGLTEQDTGNNAAMDLSRQLAVLTERDTAAIRVDLRLEQPRGRRWYDDDDRDDDRKGGGRRARGGDDDDRGRHGREGRRERDNERRRVDVSVLSVALRLDDGYWLNARSEARERDPYSQWQMVLSLAVTALSLSLLMILALRRITRPLAALAGAAERFGRGEATEILAESGPADIRDTIYAFNRMRERLERFVKDRTRMLAAISHDLRTPIAALRIRAELIDDDDTRSRILNTLEEMQRMVEATLAFVREESAEEATRSVDIAALLESICDDMSDLGADVGFSGPGKTPYRCRPLSLKRALQNLLENAVSYGLRARVDLSVDAGYLTIVVDDDGPGISEPDRERIFEPFVRLESSRNLETGGVGLGLSIARSIIRSHGGDIMLGNREEGGLRVTVELPRH